MQGDINSKCWDEWHLTAHSFVSLAVLHTDTLKLFLVCSTCSKLDFQQSQEWRVVCDSLCTLRHLPGDAIWSFLLNTFLRYSICLDFQTELWILSPVDRFICIKRPPDGALESQQSPLLSPTLSHTFCTSIFVRTLTDIIHSWATFPWTYYQQDGAVPQTHPWVLPWVTDI